MAILRTLVATAAERLSLGPHPDRARQDAEFLIRHLLRRNRAWLLTHGDRELVPADADAYASFIERRRSGEPIQYITREVEFYGLTLTVNPKVLIPRPETEHLVAEIIKLSFGFPKPRILDVGTGSGAIAIAVAHDVSRYASITATDLSRSALKIARFNARQSGFDDKIRFLQGDLLEPIAGEQFDIVASNPPYVPAADRDSLSVEVRDHEPALALFAGDDGLDIYRRLIPDAFAVLEPGGYLLMEIGYGQSEPVAALCIQAGFDDINFVPDLQGILRVASARRP